MDPPGTYIRVFHPHPFEIALIRKLEAKTTSVHDAFLLLDADGDGRVSPRTYAPFYTMNLRLM